MENRQQKLNTILFQFAIPLYISWIILDHPVDKRFRNTTNIASISGFP